MADIFISYKREDRPLVRPLVRTLQERGFTVWWDSRIETGENWITLIKRALDAAGCIVVLWTPQSVGPDGIYLSEVVTAEAEQGRRKNILLPVRMQNGPRPWLHELRNEEDLSNWQSNVDDPALDRLAAVSRPFVEHEHLLSHLNSRHGYVPRRQTTPTHTGNLFLRSRKVDLPERLSRALRKSRTALLTSNSQSPLQQRSSNNSPMRSASLLSRFLSILPWLDARPRATSCSLD